MTCSDCERYKKSAANWHNKELWVGLTIEEKHQLNDILNLQGRFPVIDAIEAKLKEKNT